MSLRLRERCLTTRPRSPSRPRRWSSYSGAGCSRPSLAEPQGPPDVLLCTQKQPRHSRQAEELKSCSAVPGICHQMHDELLQGTGYPPGTEAQRHRGSPPPPGGHGPEGKHKSEAWTSPCQLSLMLGGGDQLHLCLIPKGFACLSNHKMVISY